jgi:hypothetical protein
LKECYPLTRFPIERLQPSSATSPGYIKLLTLIAVIK